MKHHGTSLTRASLALLAFALLGSRDPSTIASPCQSFAWWIGTWGYAVPGYDPAVSTVTASDDGCTIDEAFVDRGGQKQHTTIRLDSTSQNWTRLVVDPFRSYRSAGAFAADGGIAFYETATDRETYKPVDRDHVHFLGEKSEDGGKSWRLLFDATYTRR